MFSNPSLQISLNTILPKVFMGPRLRLFHLGITVPRACGQASVGELQ